jgi:hypothetical protein
MPPLNYQLMDLYPQSGDGRPSVTYVPLRHLPPAVPSQELRPQKKRTVE